MRFLLLLTALSALTLTSARPSNDHRSLFISTSSSLATCEEAVVDVKGGRAPFTLSLVNEQGHQLAHWSNQYAQGRYSLPVKAHAGERIAWRIVDSQGTEASTSPRRIAQGESTDCMPAPLLVARNNDGGYDEKDDKEDKHDKDDKGPMVVTVYEEPHPKETKAPAPAPMPAPAPQPAPAPPTMLPVPTYSFQTSSRAPPPPPVMPPPPPPPVQPPPPPPPVAPAPQPAPAPPSNCVCSCVPVQPSSQFIPQTPVPAPPPPPPVIMSSRPMSSQQPIITSRPQSSQQPSRSSQQQSSRSQQPFVPNSGAEATAMTRFWALATSALFLLSAMLIL